MIHVDDDGEPIYGRLDPHLRRRYATEEPSEPADVLAFEPEKLGRYYSWRPKATSEAAPAGELTIGHFPICAPVVMPKLRAKPPRRKRRRSRTVQLTFAFDDRQ